MQKYVKIIFKHFLHLILRIGCIIYNHQIILAGTILETNLLNRRYAQSGFQIPLSNLCPSSITYIILYYIIFVVLQPICLSVYLSIYLSIYLSVCLSVYLSIYLSIHPPIYQKVHGYINYRIKQDSSFDRPVLKNQHTFREFDESLECKILNII